MADRDERKNWLWSRVAAIAFATVVATFVLDQANKWWMLNVYDIIEKGRHAWLPFLDVVFVKNVGVSYGLGANESMTVQYGLAGFALVASVVMWVMAVRAHSALVAVSLGLIIGGALGNAVDRLHLGGVADFYLLHAAGYEWYVFNIADAAIVAGVVGLLYDLLVVSRGVAANAG